MNDTFWTGFEKEAGPLGMVGATVGAAHGLAQRGAAAASRGMQNVGNALRSGTSNLSEAATRTAVQAQQRVSVGYRSGQRKALGMNPADYGAMRRDAAAKATAKAQPAAKATAQTGAKAGAGAQQAAPAQPAANPTAAAAPPGALQRGFDRARSAVANNPVKAVGGGLALAGAGTAAYLATHQHPQPQMQQQGAPY